MLNFKTIILPEALKLIRNENDSFLFITTALKDLTAGIPTAVLNLVEKFEGYPFEEVSYSLIPDLLHVNVRK